MSESSGADDGESEEEVPEEEEDDDDDGEEEVGLKFRSFEGTFSVASKISFSLICSKGSSGDTS